MSESAAIRQFPRPLPQLERGLSIHQLAMIREAILRVIDDGCICEADNKHPWQFDADGDQEYSAAFTEDMANEQRLKFCDAVQSILVEREKGRG